MSVPPTASPLPTPFTSCVPSVPRPSVRLYIKLLRTNELFTLSCFLALFIVDGRSEYPLGTLSLLTCDYAAGLVLYSFRILMPVCHFFWLLFLSLMDTFPPLESAVICHPPSVHLHLLCRLVGFPLLSLTDNITPQVLLWPMAEVMLEVDDVT